MYIDFNDIVIELDASVRHITSAACMHLSSILENGIDDSAVSVPRVAV